MNAHSARNSGSKLPLFSEKTAQMKNFPRNSGKNTSAIERAPTITPAIAEIRFRYRHIRVKRHRSQKESPHQPVCTSKKAHIKRIKKGGSR